MTSYSNWRWRQHTPPNDQCTSTELHSVTSQKTV